MLHSDDAEERAIRSLVARGLASKDDSRRIVQAVLCAALENRRERLHVSTADLEALDDSADAINQAIWSMEDSPAGDHRGGLRELVVQTQRILKVARGYLLGDSGAPEDGMKGE